MTTRLVRGGLVIVLGFVIGHVVSGGHVVSPLNLVYVVLLTPAFAVAAAAIPARRRYRVDPAPAMSPSAGEPSSEDLAPSTLNPVVVVNGQVTTSDPRQMRKAGRKLRSSSMSGREMVFSSFLAVLGLAAGALVLVFMFLMVLLY